MNILYPKFPVHFLPAMIRSALLGALIAGCYGIIHDQITYSISSEYFTRLKFAQFHYANFGLPARFFVAEIGFLATWWVGFIAGWFLARMSVPSLPPATARRHCFSGFAIILACSTMATIIGFGLGLLRGAKADFSAWRGFAETRGVLDLPSFVRVAYIHNASYLGGLIGLIIALVHLRRLKRTGDANLTFSQAAHKRSAG
jgi:hypothetical protein